MAGQPMGPGIIAMPGIATGIALWSTHEGRKRLLSLGHRRGVCLRAVTGGGGAWAWDAKDLDMRVVLNNEAPQPAKLPWPWAA